MIVQNNNDTQYVCIVGFGHVSSRFRVVKLTKP